MTLGMHFDIGTLNNQIPSNAGDSVKLVVVHRFLKFIQSLVDFISMNKAIMMVSASPAAFDGKELKQLEREFQQVFI